MCMYTCITAVTEGRKHCQQYLVERHHRNVYVYLYYSSDIGQKTLPAILGRETLWECVCLLVLQQ